MLDSISTASTQFTLDADQIAVREMARAFAAEAFAPNAIAWDEAKHFPIAEMRKAAALGMGGIFVAEDLGGSGLSRLTGTLIFEALATGCPTTAAFMSIHNMVAGLIDVFGSDEQRRRWLPKLCAMDLLASYCLSEPGAGSDAAALATRATREGDNYVLKGQKQFISGAGASDLYLVMARSGGEGPSGISAFVVPADTPGLSFGANERKMGWNAQPTRAVIFEDARVPAANRLGAGDERLDEVRCGDHGSPPCLPKSFRRFFRPRCVATFSAATDMPLWSAASLSDISSSFSMRIASRCPGGRPPRAARSARPSDAASW